MSDTYGLAVAAVQIGSDHPKDSRIFYQKAADGAIYQRVDAETENVIVTSNNVREATPIAAIAMDGEFNEIHVYYVDQDDILCEIYFSNNKWADGSLNDEGFVVLTDSSFLYAFSGAVTDTDRIKVGFLRESHPDAITEAVYRNGEWSTDHPPSF